MHYGILKKNINLYVILGVPVFFKNWKTNVIYILYSVFIFQKYILYINYKESSEYIIKFTNCSWDIVIINLFLIINDSQLLNKKKYMCSCLT